MNGNEKKKGAHLSALVKVHSLRNTPIYNAVERIRTYLRSMEQDYPDFYRDAVQDQVGNASFRPLLQLLDDLDKGIDGYDSAGKASLVLHAAGAGSMMAAFKEAAYAAGLSPESVPNAPEFTAKDYNRLKEYMGSIANEAEELTNAIKNGYKDAAVDAKAVSNGIQAVGFWKLFDYPSLEVVMADGSRFDREKPVSKQYATLDYLMFAVPLRRVSATFADKILSIRQLE